MAKLDPKAGIAAAIAAAVTLAAPLTETWEGFVPQAKPDPVGIATYCFGETQGVDPLRVYSRDECGDKLRARLASDYAPALLKCMPALAENRNAFAALLDAAYNTGPAAVCAHMAPLVNAGQIADACASLPGWYVTSRDRRTGQRVKLRGLVNRRTEEARLCTGKP